jgi:hypothetical protein
MPSIITFLQNNKQMQATAAPANKRSDEQLRASPARRTKKHDDAANAHQVYAL